MLDDVFERNEKEARYGYIHGMCSCRGGLRPYSNPINDRVDNSRLDLTTGSTGWRVEILLKPLQPGTTSRIYGWTQDDSWSADGVEFSLEDLRQLQPGQIRYDARARADEDNPDDTTATIPAEQFRSEVCN